VVSLCRKRKGLKGRKDRKEKMINILYPEISIEDAVEDGDSDSLKLRAIIVRALRIEEQDCCIFNQRSSAFAVLICV